MFVEIVNQLAKTYQSDDREPYYARPSMAGPERCIRAMVYHGANEPASPYPGRAILTMDDSSWHEELTVQWYERSVLRIHSRQMPVDLPAPCVNKAGHYCKICDKWIGPEIIHGHIDWIEEPPVGEEALVEHKALSYFQCQRIENGYLPMDNIIQACIYSAALQRLQPDLKRINLLIKNKNTAQYIEFEMVYNAEQDSLLIERRIVSKGDAPAEIIHLMSVIEKPVSAALEKFVQVEAMVESKTLPARPFEPDTEFPCGYCRYAKTCWDKYEEEFTALSTDVALSEEIATAARFYKELGAQEGAIKKQKEEVKETLKEALDSLGARSGRAGEYLISMTSYKKEEINKALVPVEAISETTHYKFSCTKIKEKKNGKVHANKGSGKAPEPSAVAAAGEDPARG